MKRYRFLLSGAVLLLTVLVVSPFLQAAKKQPRATPKAHAAKTAVAAPQENVQKHVEQEIAAVKEDVYTRATWKKLQEVKQEADDTASSVRLLAFGACGVGFLLGCVVTFLVTRRPAGSEENLKIT